MYLCNRCFSILILSIRPFVPHPSIEDPAQRQSSKCDFSELKEEFLLFVNKMAHPVIKEGNRIRRRKIRKSDHLFTPNEFHFALCSTRRLGGVVSAGRPRF